MAGDEVSKPRAAHSGILTKIYARFVTRPVNEFLPYVRYMVLPSMFYYSLYVADPPATFWELINPFTK